MHCWFTVDNPGWMDAPQAIPLSSSWSLLAQSRLHLEHLDQVRSFIPWLYLEAPDQVWNCILGCIWNLWIALDEVSNFITWLRLEPLDKLRCFIPWRFRMEPLDQVSNFIWILGNDKANELEFPERKQRRHTDVTLTDAMDVRVPSDIGETALRSLLHLAYTVEQQGWRIFSSGHLTALQVQFPAARIVQSSGAYLNDLMWQTWSYCNQMAEEQFKAMVMPRNLQKWWRIQDFSQLCASHLHSTQQQVNYNIPWTANLSDLMWQTWSYCDQMAEEQFKMMMMREICRSDGEYKTLVNSVLRSPALYSAASSLQYPMDCKLEWFYERNLKLL